MSDPAFYFRFDNTTGCVFVNSFRVMRRTKKGVWIDVWGLEKFVLDGEGRRYAYPTEDAAWASFKVRKMRQRQHLESAIDALSQTEPLTKLTWQEAVKKSADPFSFDLVGIMP